MNELFGQSPMAVGLGTPLPSVEEMNEEAKAGLMRKPEDEQDEEKASREKLVGEWIDRVKKSRTHFEKVFKKMRDDQQFVRGKQWPGQTADDQRYVANVTQRHVNQRVAALYAKNPTVAAKRRQTIDFTLWDESTQSVQEAMATLAAANQAMAAGLTAPPSEEVVAQVRQASMLLQELQSIKERRLMLDRMGKTMEILFHYYMREQEPTFKIQAKQLIRRTEINGVGYVKLGFQRVMELRPDASSKIGDMTQRVAHMKRLAYEVMEQGGDASQASAEVEQLEVAIESLRNQEQVIAKEGLVFDFPRSTSIIIDKNCVNLRGFIGAGWIAQEFDFTCDEIKEIYGVDLAGGKAIRYQKGDGANNEEVKGSDTLRCWEVYHKADGTTFTLCDGYNDFLIAPKQPDVKVERFWPIFALTFNDIEDEDCIYPDSDVRLIRAMQVEHNRAREGLREHRIANRPAYGGAKGVLDENDKGKLASHDINEFIEFNIPPGTDIKTVVQPMQKVAIDAAVYDTSPFFDDVQKVVGAQEANFGGVSGVAATEVSVAEGARISTLQSNIDDLDDFLSDIARSAGQIMLREISPETAKKIAGPGAVWPQLSAQELAEELYLEIEAGSSGRPNKAQEIANMERIAPTVLQVPGINPAWLAKKVVKVIDDGVDLSDALIESMPSMTAMNAMSRPGTGDPETDPNQQGSEGGDKTKNPQDRPGGSQPSYQQPGDNIGG